MVQKRMKKRGYISVVFDNFSKFEWTIQFENEISQTITESLENTLILSESKPISTETALGKKLENKIWKKLHGEKYY